MRWRSATYRVPLLNATPLGAFNPFKIFLTSRLPPRSTIAYTSDRLRLPTNTVPLSPSASERASGTPSAQTSTLKPAGTFSLFTGNSLEGRPVKCGANGCSGDDWCSVPRPCCHDGGGVVAAPGGAIPGVDPWTCAAGGALGGEAGGFCAHVFGSSANAAMPSA